LADPVAAFFGRSTYAPRAPSASAARYAERRGSIATGRAARYRQDDPIPTLKRQAAASGEHLELRAQDQDFDIAGDINAITAGGQQTQEAANSKVEKRR
jgi:hypothetical protein